MPTCPWCAHACRHRGAHDVRPWTPAASAGAGMADPRSAADSVQLALLCGLSQPGRHRRGPGSPFPRPPLPPRPARSVRAQSRWCACCCGWAGMPAAHVRRSFVASTPVAVKPAALGLRVGVVVMCAATSVAAPPPHSPLVSHRGGDGGGGGGWASGATPAAAHTGPDGSHRARPSGEHHAAWAGLGGQLPPLHPGPTGYLRHTVSPDIPAAPRLPGAERYRLAGAPVPCKQPHHQSVPPLSPFGVWLPAAKQRSSAPTVKGAYKKRKNHS